MPRYVTLEEIKAQCIVDADFTDDDNYLKGLGDAAEDMVSAEIDSPLDDIVAANNGKLPSSLKMAILLITDYLYSSNRGSSENNEIPAAFLHLCTLWRNWGATR